MLVCEHIGTVECVYGHKGLPCIQAHSRLTFDLQKTLSNYFSK